MELLLKDLIDGAYGIITGRQQIQAAKGEAPLAFTVKAPRDLKHHDLPLLLQDAEAALNAIGYPIPVPGLRALVELCESIERGDETRWRYARGKKGQLSFDGGLLAPPEELPIGEIHERLVRVMTDEQVGKSYEEVMKEDTISSYRWSMALEVQGIDHELYAVGLL